MANHQESPAFTSAYDAHDHYDDTAAASGCGCFWRFYFRRNEDESHNSLLHEKEGEAPPQPEPWHVAKLKKVRELSEVVAGPKWRKSVRKMGKICNTRTHNKTGEEFHYSPESYALNFASRDGEEDGEKLHSFSTRFAPGCSINDQQRRQGF